MLAELVKKDKEWLKMAMSLCKDKDLAKDIVQDMYLYFHDKDIQVNSSYIFSTIKHLFLHTLKKNQNLSLSGCEHIIDNIRQTDDDYDLMKDSLSEFILEEVNSLPFYERTLLKETMIISQRSLAEETGIPLTAINKTIVKTKKKLCKIVNQKIKVLGML